ncbi:MAG: His/Gly/Thr/Pro-type tRNA ligase C-terminal domain-containing protein, partial [Myxococcota bacterium]
RNPIQLRAADPVAKLKAGGVRAKLDDDSAKLGYRIRRAELDRIPYALIVGGREAENGTVGVRKRLEGDLGAMPFGDFLARIQHEDTERVH